MTGITLTLWNKVKYTEIYYKSTLFSWSLENSPGSGESKSAGNLAEICHTALKKYLEYYTEKR